MFRKFVRIGSAIAGLAIVVSCGGSGSTGPSNSTNGTGTGNGTGGYGDPGGGTNNNVCAAGTFCMRDATFDPTSLTVAVGAAVTWENSSGVLHHVVFTSPASANAVGAGKSGDIGDIASGSVQRSFGAAGKYDFHCTIHAGMTGSLTVQ